MDGRAYRSAKPVHGVRFFFGNGFNHSKYQILVLSQETQISKTVGSVKLDGNPLVQERTWGTSQGIQGSPLTSIDFVNLLADIIVQ